MAEEATASVIMSGRSQAVRIPKAFWINAERVKIRKRGESLVLTPVEKEDQWASLKEVIATIKKEGLTFEIPDEPEWEDYPRIGFNESVEHFNKRVHEYEKRRDAKERAWKAEHGN